MAINIKFDLVGNPEPPTMILANRNGNKLGQLKVNNDSINLSDKLSNASEFTFTLNKYIKGKLTNLWDDVVDFKLVYCKEWDLWFEIKVEIDEDIETVKTVFCKQLGQSELSQILLYDIEINTEKDIERDDYKISILYDRINPKNSILHRILEKAPHYSIEHVDSTIANIQRSFSFNDTSIVDAFNSIAEEIGCLFVYNSNSGEDGSIRRTISVYDLQQNCFECGHRGEFTDVCPKCGSRNIKNGYGEDTLIFVTSDELAANGIQLVTHTDSVKNCFKLEAGDDLMTATVRNCNPNGTDYIWYFSDSIKQDMSQALVDKIDGYNAVYRNYYDNHESNIDTNLLDNYNSLVDKYTSYKKDLQKISTPIKGYSSLMNAYYNVVDLSLFLESALMPSIEISETNAAEQAGLLTANFPSTVAVANIRSASLSTANSAVLTMAKIIAKSTYKIEVKSSEISDNGNDTKTWRGNFTITNYSDEEDTATSSTISVMINGDEETFIKQKIDKLLNKEDTDDYSISGLFEKDYNSFCNELKRYALNPLISFRDAGQACIDILIEQGVGDNSTWGSTETGSDSNLYEKLYAPYHDKLLAIEAEIKVREIEINLIKGVYDTDGNLVTDGLSTNIVKCKKQIQDALDFQGYLGEDLWTEFCSYRREDKYSNSNYISDGLNNTELFEKALEFIEVAENEIYKSSELQHSISTTLKNLLAIDKFEPLVSSFKNGNWIRVQVDDELYKLRLLEYEIDYGNFNNIPVEFSDVMKIKNGITDLEDILSQATSMTTSYDTVKKQAEQGNNADTTISRWLESGLNSALVQIQNNNDEEITLSKNGLLCRSYDDISDTYSPEQLKITHNIMAYTADDWRTVKLAIGKHDYKTYSSSADNWVTDTGYGVSADFVTAGQVTGSKIVGGEIYSSNYHKGIVGSSTNSPKGTYINLATGYVELGSGRMIYDPVTNVLSLNGVQMDWNNTNPPAIDNVEGLGEYVKKVGNLEVQLDKRAETWYQDTDPSVAWTDSDTKELHVGDLWHYTGETGNVNGVKRIKNSEWVWGKVNNNYQWSHIEISDDVFDAIDTKRQIFTSEPEPPYDIGDLWVQGSNGDIMNCIRAKQEGSFDANDWAKSSKYTDDTVAIDALEKAKQGIADAASGIKLANAAQGTADAANTAAGKAQGTADAANTAAAEAKTAAAEAKTAASTAETNAKAYTDAAKTAIETSLTSAYQSYTNTEVSKLDTEVGKYLGLGGNTLVDSNYIISPYIAGGYLNIANATNKSRVLIDPNNLTETGYIFQVQSNEKITVAIDASGNATFQGKITSSSFESGAITGGIIKSTNASGTYIDLNNDLISLGKKDADAIINLCGGSGNISYGNDEYGEGLTMSSGNTLLKSPNGVMRFTNSYTYSSDRNWSNILMLNRQLISLTSQCTSTGAYARLSVGTESGVDKISDIHMYATNINANGNFNAKSGITLPNAITVKGENVHGTSYEIMRMGGTTENPDVLIIGDGFYANNIGSTRLSGGVDIQLLNKNNRIIFEAVDNDTTHNANFRPRTDGNISLGTASYRWYTVYASNSTVQTSDKREKENIVALDTSDLFDKLKPVQYNFINGNGRVCYGLIAQDVVETLHELDIGENELDLVHHDYFVDEETKEEKDSYGVAYTNIIAMLVHEVQKLKIKNNNLEKKFSELEMR